MVGIRPFYLTAIVVAGLALGTWSAAEPTEVAPLLLEAKIPLGEVTGRIDHMTIDLPRHRLFVAELGNNTVGVVDLESRKVVQRLTRLAEPQGVGYVPANDTLYVANGGDGSVKIFRGPDYAPAGRIDLGKDADNIRVDAATTLLYVGYGDGGIGVIDPQSNSKIKAFPLKAHPESFQLENAAGEMFVNLPNARSIAVLNKIGELRATWPMRYGANFAMAIDNERKRVLVVFRNPAKFAAFDMQTGTVAGETDACGDADDLFLDAKRKRIYISCGAGFIDVLNADDPKYLRLARVPTVSGARTALYVPEMDQFLLAVRAHAAEPAAIWVYRAAR